MKVSEAIERLTTILEDEGDIDIFTNTEGDYGDPTGFSVEEEDGETFVELQSDLITEDDEEAE